MSIDPILIFGAILCLCICPGKPFYCLYLTPFSTACLAVNLIVCCICYFFPLYGNALCSVGDAGKCRLFQSNCCSGLFCTTQGTYFIFESMFFCEGVIFCSTGTSVSTIFIVLISVCMCMFWLFRIAFFTYIIFVGMFFCKAVIPCGTRSGMSTVFVILISVCMSVLFWLFRAAFFTAIIFIGMFLCYGVVPCGTSSSMGTVFVVLISIDMGMSCSFQRNYCKPAYHRRLTCLGSNCVSYKLLTVKRKFF